MSSIEQRIKKIEQDPKLNPKDDRIFVFWDGIWTDRETGEQLTREEVIAKYGDFTQSIVVEWVDGLKDRNQ